MMFYLGLGLTEGCRMSRVPGSEELTARILVTRAAGGRTYISFSAKNAARGLIVASSGLLMLIDKSRSACVAEASS